MTNQKSIDITVKFQVASYKTGQLQVRSKFLKVLKNRAKNLIKFNGLNNVLSLNNLAKDPEMEEVEFNLGSNAVFSMLTTLMAHYQTELFANVTGLLLADNGLRQMSVVKMLSTQNLQLVDISNNKVRFVNNTEMNLIYFLFFFCLWFQIDHVSKLAGLEKLNFTQLIVTGNTFERDPGYVKYIRKNFPKVITVVSLKLYIYIYIFENTTPMNTIYFFILLNTIKLIFFQYIYGSSWSYIIINFILIERNQNRDTQHQPICSFVSE